MIISSQADQLVAVHQDAERVRLEAYAAAAQIHSEAVVQVNRTEIAAYQLQQETFAGAQHFQANLAAQFAEQARQSQINIQIEARRQYELEIESLKQVLEGTLARERAMLEGTLAAERSSNAAERILLQSPNSPKKESDFNSLNSPHH